MASRSARIYASAMKLLWYLPLLLLLIAGSIWWSSTHSRTIIENWAADNGYYLIDAHAPFVGRGPFFWTTSRGQTVYRVTVEDSSGQTRLVWARCVNWLWQSLSDQIEVRWDDEP